MPKFIFAYHGGQGAFETPEQGQAHMKAWMAWEEDHKDVAVNPGMPVGMSKTVSKDSVEDNGGVNPISGVGIFECADFDAALKIAKACPHVNIGTIEVAEVMNMGPKKHGPEELTRR